MGEHADDAVEYFIERLRMSVFRPSKEGRKMVSNSDAYVSAEVLFKTYTDNAIMVAFDGEEAWIPRSVLSFRCDILVEDWPKNSEQTVTLKMWKADQLGMDWRQ